jgi:hypothetical protein
MGRAKQEKFWEVKQARHTQQGQDRELYPFLHLIGELLHCSTPATPSEPKPKKESERERGEKVFFLGVGAADSKTKTTRTSVDAKFSPIICLAFPSFHSTPHHWITIIPSHRFPHLAQNKLGTMAGTTVLCTQYPARVTKYLSSLSSLDMTDRTRPHVPSFLFS